MQSSPPPALPRQGRPRYLVVALVAAIVFGAGCWTEGCGRLTFYRGERDHLAALNGAVHEESARAKVDRLYERFLEVSDIERNRAIPLAAATFVLGAALLALAARGFGGRSNTRSALVQVVAVQAVVVAVGFFATKASREAELDWQVELRLAEKREGLPADQYAQLVPVVDSIRRFGAPSWLVMRSIASALIILALTRPRSRDFFDAAAGSLPQR